MSEAPTYSAFLGARRLATGPLHDTLTAVKTALDALTGPRTQPLIVFNDETGRPADFDWRGTLEEVLARHAPAPSRTGPGRPKLGVVSREVSLLPRHWDWLESHPNGASAALRRLIDEARKADPEGERRRVASLAADRFLTVMAGDLPGAEDASRALYAAERGAFEAVLAPWPEDIRLHALYLAAPAFGQAQ
ncbi:DUF2239 family protein [Deinococcus sp. HMF7604]|uniref:DUF2239 family protein n=1 Tax=Deinococcus betulae TaxID=2873312 RepID=UPI001CCEA2A7|nr:DUF2239 family protein [Deinococcus betulae]MBZ9751025.1 DUF2239 family protein [Deinococcus betulae]